MDGKKDMEGCIQHFKSFTSGFSLGDCEVFVSTEAPKGEFGIYVCSQAGVNTPTRVKFRAPGFFHLQGINFLSKSHLLADVVTVIGSLDVVFGEVDR
jgi:NADH:ubiquinone oxidoreductase subunit D